MKTIIAFICLFVAFINPAHAADQFITLKYNKQTKDCKFNLTVVPNKVSAETYIGEFGEGCPGYVPPEPPVPPPGDCTGVKPPEGYTQSLTATTFASQWGMFPGSQGNRKFAFTKTQYLSLEFTVPTMGITAGRFSIISTGTPQPVSVTVSECKGDFRAQQAKGCAIDLGNETNFNYVTNYSGGYKCNIQSGRKYYLNIIGAPLDSTTSTCKTAMCAVLVGNYPP